MEDKNVPYIVYESSIARMERVTKRLVVALVIAILLIFASNAIWLYFWNQYEYEVGTEQIVTVDGKSGVANYIGNSGDIINGKDSRNNQKNSTETEEER